MPEEIIWEDPPPAGGRSRVSYQELTEAMDKHPGKWLVVGTYRSVTAGSAGGVLNWFRSRGYETAQRRIMVDGEKVLRVFARKPDAS